MSELRAVDKKMPANIGRGILLRPSPPMFEEGIFGRLASGWDSELWIVSVASFNR